MRDAIAKQGRKRIMEKKLEQRKDMGSGASERHYYELGEVRDAIARQAKSRWWRKNWNSWKP